MSLFSGRTVTAEEVIDEEVVKEEAAVAEARRDPTSLRTCASAIILTAVPWFFMDVATYGVGIFTPTILGALALGSSPTNTFLQNDVISTDGAVTVDVFLVLGFIAALILVGRVNFVGLQGIGFVVMAAGLVLLGSTSLLPGGPSAWVALVFIGFGAFNLFMNMGPNPVTYLMPTAAFPTASRARGSGIAAASGKAGAAIGTLFFPILMMSLGLFWTLAIVAAGCLVAAAVTWSFGHIVQAEVAASRTRPGIRRLSPAGSAASS